MISESEEWTIQWLLGLSLVYLALKTNVKTVTGREKATTQ